MYIFFNIYKYKICHTEYTYIKNIFSVKLTTQNLGNTRMYFARATLFLPSEEVFDKMT